MKNKLLKLLSYLIALAIDFYILPLLIKDTGSGMFMMLIVIPLIAFLCAVIYGVKQGFGGLLPLGAAVLFAPTIFIYYNETAWVYIVGYAVVAAVGNGIGRMFYKKA